MTAKHPFTEGLIINWEHLPWCVPATARPDGAILYDPKTYRRMLDPTSFLTLGNWPSPDAVEALRHRDPEADPSVHDALQAAQRLAAWTVTSGGSALKVAGLRTCLEELWKSARDPDLFVRINQANIDALSHFRGQDREVASLLERFAPALRSCSGDPRLSDLDRLSFAATHIGAGGGGADTPAKGQQKPDRMNYRSEPGARGGTNVDVGGGTRVQLTG